ncbi:hypothetical protein C8A05DRAFT_15628 [Staphylotrichum tortipilum]|uniref:Uncharacterized protein n=1 Tax=Staphylotrichum tortipilum TaxID=2831512 RepID=A0AAN6MJZ5_9PEZI|nr:hypothetical protein C8A05DRAFT_15628 [Staphylotrichum longicolle]
MLCGIHPPSNHHQHRFLRSFRSHKSLRQHSHDDSISSTTSTVYPFYPDEMHPRRHRPSDASSLACPSLEPSSRRPSTASGSSDVSIDWDPLRLNPPNLAPGSPPPLLHDVFADMSLTSSTSPTPSKLRHAHSSQVLRAPPPPPSQPQPSPRHAQQQQQQQPPPTFNTVIYSGFDFGFPNAPSPPTTTTPPTYSRRQRAPSLTPSIASSECSLVSGSASSLDEQLEEGLCLGLAPPPAPRARPRPQRDGEGEAEEFIRRGAWKRRGIVFGMPGEGVAGEEETFEI